MKKLIALLLALVMLFSLMACTTKETPEKDEEKTSDSEKPAEDKKDDKKEEEKEDASELEEEGLSFVPGQLPYVAEGEEVTLTIGVCQNPNVTDYEDNDFTRYIEENLGVNLDFVMFSSDGAEAATQVSLMIAGGEKLPDILWGFNGIKKDAYIEYGRDGYFVDMRPYFENGSAYFFDQETAAHFAEYKESIILNGADPEDGAMYAFPYFKTDSLTGGDTAAHLVAINQVWLDAIGEDMPTNVDELENVLRKFANEDPNGNGTPDELGLLGMNYDRGHIMDFVANAYVYNFMKYFFNVTDGELWVPYTTDEWRQALIRMNQWYEEGLISDLTYTVSVEGDMKAYFTPANGTAITGVFAGHPVTSAEVDNMVLAEYAALPPLADETGLGGYAPRYDAYYYYRTYISADCEHPELAFAMLDFLCLPESYMASNHGLKDRDWREAEAGELDAAGNQAGLVIINQNVRTDPSNATWKMNAVGLLCTTWWTTSGAQVEPGSFVDVRNKLCTAQGDNFRNGRQPDEIVYTLLYNAEEQAVVSEVETMLKEYICEARDMFVTGILDPNSDADWETYLQNCEGQGLSRWLEAAQAAYDRANG